MEEHNSELSALQKKADEAEKSAAASKAALEKTLKDLQRALPFEKEVKEKNLLIGKLRHEAVTLNEHLTKALRILKKGRPEENVDRQIVTNYILHFLAIDRSDPKKFEALQLIASLLGWTDGMPPLLSPFPFKPNSLRSSSSPILIPPRAKRTSRSRSPRRIKQLSPHPPLPVPPYTLHALTK